MTKVDPRYSARRRSVFTNKVSRMHVLIAENVLGKALPVGAQVHHVDSDPNNNENSNLVICPNQAYHKLLHKRTEALEACGNAAHRKCVFCKEWDSIDNMAARHDNNYHHRNCVNRYEIARYNQKRHKP